ncbi:MAG: hypothetical protein RIQ98_570 [Bacteroidota bacterium]
MDQRKIVLSFLFLANFCALGQKSTNDDFVVIAKKFLGRPYQGHMLSSGNPERLITSQEAFDCVTFIEHSLATKISNADPNKWVSALKHVRYAGDSVQFEKRYHYFSDAMRNLGFSLIQDPKHHSIATKDFSFLSNYLKDKGDKTVNIGLLAMREGQLKAEKFEYTSIKDLPFLLPLIQDGDLIGLVGKKDHLDFLHTAIAVKKGTQVHLLHASQEKKKVIVSDETLTDYLKSHRQFIGISVFRPKFSL